MDNTPTPSMPQQGPMQEPPKKEGGMGSVVAIVIILLLLIAGGIYYFTVGVGELTNGVDTSFEDATEEEVAALNEQGTSDELADIEADLNATDLSGLDEASTDFEAELESQ